MTYRGNSNSGVFNNLWSIITFPFRFSGILNRKPVLPFTDAMSQLQTGDIFLARGRANVSRFIEAVTQCNWSHVGMVVIPHEVGLGDNQKPHLWESTTHDEVDDYLSEKGIKGPMLVDLESRLRGNLESGDYEVFAIRYVNRPLSAEERTSLGKYIQRLHDEPTTFPEIPTLIGSAWKYRAAGLLMAKQEKAYFCSQLVSETFQKIGLMPDTHDPKSYIPRDFSAAGYAPFLGRLTMGPEIFVGKPGGTAVLPHAVGTADDLKQKLGVD